LAHSQPCVVCPGPRAGGTAALQYHAASMRPILRPAEPRPLKRGTPIRDALWRVGLAAAYACLRAWWFVRRPRLLGVCVLIRCGEWVLLVRHSYKPGWAPPGGWSHAREDPVAAAIREVGEEMGIDVGRGDLGFVGVLEESHDFRRAVTTFFEVVVQEEPAVAIDRREIIEAGWGFIPELDRLDLWPSLREFLPRYRETLGLAP
jgi:8-oxo-dGTP pyrophosphatase MutT (NUDIX family)